MYLPFPSSVAVFCFLGFLYALYTLAEKAYAVSEIVSRLHSILAVRDSLAEPIRFFVLVLVDARYLVWSRCVSFSNCNAARPPTSRLTPSFVRPYSSGFANSGEIHPLFGPILMVVYACLSNTRSSPFFRPPSIFVALTRSSSSIPSSLLFLLKSHFDRLGRHPFQDIRRYQSGCCCRIDVQEGRFDDRRSEIGRCFELPGSFQHHCCSAHVPYESKFDRSLSVSLLLERERLIDASSFPVLPFATLVPQG